MNTLLLIFINLSILVIAYIISMVILNHYEKKYNMSLASLFDIDYDLSLWTNYCNLQLAFDCINRTIMGSAGITLIMLILMHSDRDISTSDALFLTVIPNLLAISMLNTMFVIDGTQEIYKIYKKLHNKAIKF